jgi:hypothetical protein
MMCIRQIGLFRVEIGIITGTINLEQLCKEAILPSWVASHVLA